MKKVKFNASHYYDHLLFEGGKEYDLTAQQYNDMNGIDVNGMPLAPGSIKLFVDVSGSTAPAKEKA